MKWLTAALRERFTLFVDDVGFTLALLAWIVVAGLGLPRTGLPAALDAPLLFLGCAAVLLVTARQAAVRRRGNEP
jgi:hypothetical protein